MLSGADVIFSMKISYMFCQLLWDVQNRSVESVFQGMIFSNHLREALMIIEWSGPWWCKGWTSELDKSDRTIFSVLLLQIVLLRVNAIWWVICFNLLLSLPWFNGKFTRWVKSQYGRRRKVAVKLSNWQIVKLSILMLGK